MSKRAINLGSRVRIARVAFPDVAHHACFIGATGTATKYIKCRDEYKVETDDGRIRYSFGCNLEAAS